jgi:hypothetical protein
LLGGIICLALAGLLGELFFGLPPDKMMFLVGARNIPFLPAIIRGIVGNILITSKFSAG